METSSFHSKIWSTPIILRYNNNIWLKYNKFKLSYGQYEIFNLITEFDQYHELNLY